MGEKVKKSVYLEAAPAKINLFLEIKDKREDAYHNLQTLFQAIDLTDNITFEITADLGKSEEIDFEIMVDSNDEILRNLGEENLVVKAIEIYFANLPDSVLSQIKNIIINIFIDKNIPLNAGLGGGSANAGATLRAFNNFFDENFKVSLSSNKLLELSLALGSDVPFALLSTDEHRLYAESRGEKFMDPPDSIKELLDFDYSKYSQVILVKPKFGIPTASAFELFAKEGSKKSEAQKGFFNRFEELILKTYPELEFIKKSLLDHGCQYAMLSGSGSTMLGFIEAERDPSIILNELNTELKDCDVFTANFLS